MRQSSTGVMLSALCATVLLAGCTTDRAEPVVAAPVAQEQPRPQPPAARPPEPPPPPAGPTIVEGSRQDFEQNVGDRVFFDYDRSDLDQTDRDTLQRQAQWLARYPNVVLVVEGHADERGTREYNLALAARRAASVREFLTSLGVSGARLETISYGKERPVCVESTEQCWQVNRRGVSVIKSGEVAAAF